MCPVGNEPGAAENEASERPAAVWAARAEAEEVPEPTPEAAPRDAGRPAEAAGEAEGAGEGCPLGARCCGAGGGEAAAPGAGWRTADDPGGSASHDEVTGDTSSMTVSCPSEELGAT